MEHNTAYQIKSPLFSIMKIEISTKSRAIFINHMSVAVCYSANHEKFFFHFCRLLWKLVSISITFENQERSIKSCINNKWGAYLIKSPPSQSVTLVICHVESLLQLRSLAVTRGEATVHPHLVRIYQSMARTLRSPIYGSPSPSSWSLSAWEYSDVNSEKHWFIYLCWSYLIHLWNWGLHTIMWGYMRPEREVFC